MPIISETIAIRVVPLRWLCGECVAVVRPAIGVGICAAEPIYRGSAVHGRTVVGEVAARVVAIGVTILVPPLGWPYRMAVVNIGVAISISVDTTDIRLDRRTPPSVGAVVILVGNPIIVIIFDETFPDENIKISCA